MNKKNNDEIGLPLWIRWAFCFILLVLLFVAAYFVYRYCIAFESSFFPLENRSEWGTFGDFFGGVLNPIFGFASFLALLATILYQSKELKASTKELKNSAEALAKQNRAIELQSFEQTFFSWVSTYRELLGNLTEKPNSGNLLFGKEALYQIWVNELSPWSIYQTLCKRDMYGELTVPRDEFGSYDDNFLALDSVKQLEILGVNYSDLIAIKIQFKWSNLYIREKYQLDSFFRTAYKLLTWIDSLDSSRLSNNDKWLYVSIFRSQLSWIEMLFFFYNGLTEVGNKFKPIIERYALFDNLDLESDICIKIVQQNTSSTNRYSEEAFDSDLARKKLCM